MSYGDVMNRSLAPLHTIVWKEIQDFVIDRSDLPFIDRYADEQGHDALCHRRDMNTIRLPEAVPGVAVDKGVVPVRGDLADIGLPHRKQKLMLIMSQLVCHMV